MDTDSANSLPGVVALEGQFGKSNPSKIQCQHPSNENSNLAMHQGASTSEQSQINFNPKMDIDRSSNNGVESECAESKPIGRKNAVGADDSMEDMDEHD